MYFLNASQLDIAVRALSCVEIIRNNLTRKIGVRSFRSATAVGSAKITAFSPFTEGSDSRASNLSTLAGHTPMETACRQSVHGLCMDAWYKLACATCCGVVNATPSRSSRTRLFEPVRVLLDPGASTPSCALCWDKCFCGRWGHLVPTRGWRCNSAR